ncbi:alkylmercury lyase [Halorubellus sp. JP-L1]|uniref:organomercurial lyase n=1 Tax=Halorubellus sp. JP-L1 TaxID=2715753 RepID=UPI00140B36A6|nr:organomercurial lyase [Halorubellus sp. JP-L1]NHN41286.1 alkylmercury lyase [Halorubellus sp. JP-L1]
MCNSRDDTTTKIDRDECCDANATERGNGGVPDDWLDGPDVLDAELPADLRASLGRFVGRASVDTLGEWAMHVRRITPGRSIAVEQLCHADAETEHWGTAGGERYHFQCFYDAVVLAAIEDHPVDVHTESPGGGVVEARAVGSESLSVSPESAVFSFGIANDARERSGGEPTLEDGYAAICPYVKAFPDYDAYERWADHVPAATVALPLSGATDVANALVG